MGLGKGAGPTIPLVLRSGPSANAERQRSWPHRFDLQVELSARELLTQQAGHLVRSFLRSKKRFRLSGESLRIKLRRVCHGEAAPIHLPHLDQASPAAQATAPFADNRAGGES